MQVSLISTSSRSTQLSAGTTVAILFSGGIAITFSQLLLLFTSGWEGTALGLVCFTVVLGLQLPALDVSVSALKCTFVVAFYFLSFSTFGPCEFPVATGLLNAVFGVELFSSTASIRLTAHWVLIAWPILSSASLESSTLVLVNFRTATWGLTFPS